MTKRSLFLLALFYMGLSQPLMAGEFTLEIGGFWAETDSSISGRTYNNEQIILDFEDTFKLDESQFLPYATLSYRLDKQHMFYADWKRLHREASSISERNYIIDIGGDKDLKGVAIGSEINTYLNIDILRAGYGYSLYNNEHSELGLSIGLHIMFIDVGFNGNFTGCIEREDGSIECLEEPVSTGDIVDESVTAPLPDIGVWGSYALTNNWSIAGHIQAFYIRYDNYTGYLNDVNASLRYHAGDDWMIDFGYNYYLVSADWKNNDDDLERNIKYNFQGPQLSAHYIF